MQTQIQDKFFIVWLTFLVIMLVIAACSNLKEVDPVSPPELEVHPAGWVVTDSSTFHGRFLQDSGWNLANCQAAMALIIKVGSPMKPA